MALLTSRTLIQVHSLFIFIIAVYLILSPDVITNSDIIFIIGEAMQIDLDPATSTTHFPFAICSILLISEVLVDLIIVRKLPQIDEIITSNGAYLEERRREKKRNETITPFSRIVVPPKPKAGQEGRDDDDDEEEDRIINPLLIQLATLYNEIWTFMAGLRFCFFFVVALFIYQSRSAGLSVTGGDGQVKLGLDQLKSRVVFTYVFMEMMFWLWTLSNVREERRDVARRLAEQQAAENERRLN